jgi:hypothetical protein
MHLGAVAIDLRHEHRCPGSLVGATRAVEVQLGVGEPIEHGCKEANIPGCRAIARGCDPVDGELLAYGSNSSRRLAAWSGFPTTAHACAKLAIVSSHSPSQRTFAKP